MTAARRIRTNDHVRIARDSAHWHPDDELGEVIKASWVDYRVQTDGGRLVWLEDREIAEVIT